MPEPSTKNPNKKRKRGRQEAAIGKKKNKNGKNHSVHNKNLNSIFARVAERRQKEVTLLEPALVRGLLMDIRELAGAALPSLPNAKNSTINTQQAALDIRKLLDTEYGTMISDAVTPDKRRKSWDVVNEVFRLIDTLVGKDNDDDNELETNETALQKKASTSKSDKAATDEGASKKASQTASATDKGTAKKVSQKPAAKKPAKTTGETSKNGKVSSAGAPAIAATATASNTTTSSSTTATTALHEKTQKSSTTTTQDSAKSASKSTAQKKVPARTVASLSSASAMTTAIALESKNPTVSNSKDPPARVAAPQTIPAGAVPPAYEKHSLTTQQYKNQKQQRQQRFQNNNSSSTSQATSVVSKNSASNAASTAAAGAAVASAVGVGNFGDRAFAPTTTATRPSVPTSTAPSLSAPSSILPSTTSSSNSVLKEINGNSKPKSIISTSIPEPTDVPTQLSTTVQIKLPQDLMSPTNTTIYANFVKSRPEVTIQFNPYKPTKNLIDNFKRRLEKWDPFWVIEKDFCLQVTAPTKSTRYSASNPPVHGLSTCAHFTIKDLIKFAGPRIRQIPSPSKTPEDNEYRVLIRMLPLYLSKQKGGGKNRADVHLWPKGTYIQIRHHSTIGTPQVLNQRKQQSHAPEKWLGISKHLDITNLVHRCYSSTQNSLQAASRDSEIQMGCYDPELYMFSLALCKYRSPMVLRDSLLQSNQLARVSLEEAQQRARNIMQNNEVVLDSDDDEEKDASAIAPREQKSILFSIRCPFNLSKLETPVRGRTCLHFSCFDLLNFLDLNKSASGQRWKCGYCENFLSFEDLEHCALTKKASLQFGDRITNLQHMVEFKEDGSLSLAKRVKSHQERARAKKLAAANESRTNAPKEVVELLDSDSD